MLLRLFIRNKLSNLTESFLIADFDERRPAKIVDARFGKRVTVQVKTLVVRCKFGANHVKPIFGPSGRDLDSDPPLAVVMLYSGGRVFQFDNIRRRNDRRLTISATGYDRVRRNFRIAIASGNEHKRNSEQIQITETNCLRKIEFHRTGR